MTSRESGAGTLLLRIPEAADILGIPRNVCYELVAQGRLQSVRVSERRIYVPRLALEAWFAEEANIEASDLLPGVSLPVLDSRAQQH